MELSQSARAFGAACAGAVCAVLCMSYVALADGKRELPSLVVSKLQFIVPGMDIPFPVRVGAATSAREDLVIEVRNLPPGFSLSEGHAAGSGIWWVPATRIGQATWRAAAMPDQQLEIGLALLAPQPDVARNAPPPNKPVIDQYIKRANQMLSEANVSQARRFLERAADAGSSAAARLLASTFEAEFLVQSKARGLLADPQEKQRWLTRAKALEAKQLVEQGRFAVLAEARTTVTLAPTSMLPGRNTQIVSVTTPVPPTALKSNSGRGTPEVTNTVVDVARLVAQGDRLMAEGRIAPAREYYRRAAEADDPDAALRLAATFDQRELARLGVRGIQANQAEARRWISRARELGASLPRERIMRLDSR